MLRHASIHCAQTELRDCGALRADTTTAISMRADIASRNNYSDIDAHRYTATAITMHVKHRIWQADRGSCNNDSNAKQTEDLAITTELNATWVAPTNRVTTWVVKRWGG